MEFLISEEEGRGAENKFGFLFAGTGDRALDRVDRDLGEVSFTGERDRLRGPLQAPGASAGGRGCLDRQSRLGRYLGSAH